MTARGDLELSVIIASHNRRELLRRCLNSLAGQTQDPASFEVIVADDGSSDGSAEMAEQLETPFPLHVLRLEKSGHAAAQNAALRVARAPVCLFLDDDIVASPELVAEHVAAHRDGARAIGIGSLTQQPVDAPDWFAHAFARGWEEHYEELATRPARWTDCYGANLSCPRQALLGIGGVATDLIVAYDFDLALRLYRAGCVPTYLPRAHGIHDDQKRSIRMFLDAQRQGAMHVELANRFPEVKPELLDWQAGAHPRELRLRRACLALRIPPASLAWLGHFLPGEGRRMIWLHFVRRLAFWSGVRQSTNHGQWALLTRRRSPSLQRAMVSPLPLILADTVCL